MCIIKKQLYRCFYSLDENFFDDFTTNINKRIIYQKYGLFFANIFGLRYGTFSLYIHGPYNSSLATLGYEFAQDFNHSKHYEKHIVPKINFSENTNRIINFMEDELTISDVNFLEVFSTYFYLKNYKDLSDNEILEETSKIKRKIIEENNICINNIASRYARLRQFINDTINSEIIAN